MLFGILGQEERFAILGGPTNSIHILKINNQSSAPDETHANQHRDQHRCIEPCILGLGRVGQGEGLKNTEVMEMWN